MIMWMGGDELARAEGGGVTDASLLLHCLVTSSTTSIVTVVVLNLHGLLEEHISQQIPQLTLGGGRSSAAADFTHAGNS